MNATQMTVAYFRAELARLGGNRQAAVKQLTPAALARHLEGITEKLRSGVSGKVRKGDVKGTPIKL
jgi:hypothetical protein